MIKLFITLLILIAIGCSPTPKKISSTSNLSYDSSFFKSDKVESLQSKFKEMEASMNKQQYYTQLYYTLNDSKALIKTKDWPKEFDRIYSFYKNETDDILIIDEYPYSESGDWEIFYQHFFDKKGRTFAFKRQTNFFNSICNDEDTHETIIEFFDKDFNRIGRKYNLVDENGKELNKEDCIFNYDFEYFIYPNRDELIKKINDG